MDSTTIYFKDYFINQINKIIMSTNCFVKTYKSSVNNPNLEYFDALQVTVDFSVRALERLTIVANNVFNLGGVGVKFKMLSNGVMKRSFTELLGTEYTITADDASSRIDIYQVDNTVSTVEFLIIGLSSIDGLYFSSGTDGNLSAGVTIRNPKKLQFLKGTALLNSTKTNMRVYAPYTENTGMVYPNLMEKVENPSALTGIVFVGFGENNGGYIPTNFFAELTGITPLSISAYTQPIGDITVLANVNPFAILPLRNKDVYGNIAVGLAKMTSLTILNINNSAVSGSIEDWVSALYSNGKKSASGASRIRIYSTIDTYHNVTFNGNKLLVNGTYLAWDDGGSAPTNIRFENS